MLKDFEIENAKKTFKWICDDDFQRLFVMQDKPSYEEHIKHFKKVLEDKTQKIYAIFYNDNHIGNCGLKYIKDTTSHLWIYIGDNNYRGKHLSKSACLELINKAKKIGIKTIFLHVLKTNIPAIKLYQSVGFVEIPADSEDEKIWSDKLSLLTKYQFVVE